MMANDSATLTDLHQEAEEKTVVLRSCWNCNAAHEYMRTWDDVVICCFECGHYYFKGQDLTPNMTVTQDAERPLTEKDPMGNQPEKKFRAGGVTATVWNNEIETKEGKQAYKSVSVSRSYKDKDGKWQETNSYRAADLAKLALVASKAFEYISMGAEDESE